MNYKKNILKLLIFLILVSVISYFDFWSYIFCRGSYSCEDILLYKLNSFFIFTPLFISVSLLPLFIFSGKVWGVWKKFALVAVPLMLVWIFATGSPAGGCGNFICMNRTFVIFLSGGLFLILSIIISIIFAIKFKGSSNS